MLSQLLTSPGRPSGDPVGHTTAALCRLKPVELLQAVRDTEFTSADKVRPGDPEYIAQIRRRLNSADGTEQIAAVAEGIRLSAAALQESAGITLYPVQLHAAAALITGRITQMQTGEGKTYTAIAAAGCLALFGRGVHVATPNTYLAERDADAARQILGHCGLTVDLLVHEHSVERKAEAYRCDVTYGAGHEFGFDYLRDQLEHRRRRELPPGKRLMEELSAAESADAGIMQRGLHFGIIDEADSVMMDDAGSPLILSGSTEGDPPDAQAHRIAGELLSWLKEDIHFEVNAMTGRVSLTDDGLDRIHAKDVAVPFGCLMRPWAEYIRQALTACYLFRRNVHYVIQDDAICIVDESTGRIFEDRAWQDGLHQAIELREGLPLTREREALAQITRQRFFRHYGHLSGLTGTVHGCEAEFRSVYGRRVEVIPLRTPSRRRVAPTRYFATREARLLAVLQETLEIHATGRPVLIGTQSIFETEALFEQFRAEGTNTQILNGLQDADEAAVVSTAGGRGVITIATNLAGRGTDIKLDDEVRSLGGLHVIAAECQLSERMDRQLIGRCGRQGDPGSASLYVSAEDALLERYGQWLAEAIQRDADPDGEARSNFHSQLRRIQTSAEKSAMAGRAALMRQDIQRDTLFRNAARIARQ